MPKLLVIGLVLVLLPLLVMGMLQHAVEGTPHLLLGGFLAVVALLVIVGVAGWIAAVWPHASSDSGGDDRDEIQDAIEHWDRIQRDPFGRGY